VSQVLLGFRNLAFRAAIFVVLAAILVWLLGGNLLPRATLIPQAAHTIGSPGEGEAEVRLVQVVAPRISLAREPVTWRVEEQAGYSDAWRPCEGQDELVEATAFVDVIGRGHGHPTIWFAGRPSGVTAWKLYSMGPYAARPEPEGEVADRLEAERQLARVKAGLPLQKAETAAEAREAVLKAGDAP
jgi:hypothetical protein